MSRDFIPLDARVLAVPDQVSCTVDGEVVILSLLTGEYYGLNPVAASIWDRLVEPRTVGELRDALLEDYSGVTPEECLRSLTELLRELAELGLVKLG